MNERERLAEIVLAEEFGIGPGVIVRQLVGEVDLNFRVQSLAASGPVAPTKLLKIHHVEADDVELDMQDAALRHLRHRSEEASPLGAIPFGELLGSATIGPQSNPEFNRFSGRRARLLDWTPGEMWGARPRDSASRARLGKAVATLDKALKEFRHPGLERAHRWNMLQAGTLAQPSDPWAAAVLHRFSTTVQGQLLRFPTQAIHNDANENNIVVGSDGEISLIDFGDMMCAPRIVGLGVAVAYAMSDHDDPLAAGAEVVTGYHDEVPLSPEELAVLDDVVRTRLAMSIANAQSQAQLDPQNSAYLTISQSSIAQTVRALGFVEPALAHAVYRNACGYAPVASTRRIVEFFRSPNFAPAPIVATALTRAPVLDWSATSTGATLPEDGLAIGRYREDRSVYNTEAFATPFNERRTIHMGIDVFVPEATTVYAPLDAIVTASEIRDERGDYGGVVILEHHTDDGTPFWFLLGHLAHASIAELWPGRRFEKGSPIGAVGSSRENGGWPPHIHAQLYSDLLGRATDLPGVVRKSQVDVWEHISPNPSPMLVGVSERPSVDIAAPREHMYTELLRRRRVNVSTSLSLSYREPLHIVRGDGASLIDTRGTRYLDLVNNVAHVGHEHPRVVEALAQQARRLNTNTRYVHPLLVDYAQRLRDRFADPLSVVFFTNSGSEANDLALRIARTATGRKSVLTLDWAYHGNLQSLIEISPYKFNRAGGAGATAGVGVCRLPDPYRGEYGGDGAQYALDVHTHATAFAASGESVAAFIHESISGCGGQIDLAPGYLASAYAYAREAGALVIADEVQCGLGRVGTHMWAYESHGVVPDIVTLGKPMGNGHPIGVVITSPEIARAFRNGMEYFNTFGGNPVSCAVGLEVLNVLDDERLMANAASVGARFHEGLVQLARRFESIGDVRGRGLFLGVDLVTDRDAKTPATELAGDVVEAMKRRHVLVSRDGPGDNVLKIKPPMVISSAEVDDALRALAESLDECSRLRSDTHLGANT